jgi:hypothetical protein
MIRTEYLSGGRALPTANAYRRPHIDFHGRFLGHLIATQDFDGAIDGADDAVSVMRVGG